VAFFFDIKQDQIYVNNKKIIKTEKVWVWLNFWKLFLSKAQNFQESLQIKKNQNSQIENYILNQGAFNAF